MRILYVEPYDSGSHAMFTRVLTGALSADWTVLRLPGRHWKWRMRGSAAHFATHAREALARSYDLVFASSFLPLAELLGLVPKLAGTPTILYFHENQAAFPWRETPADRDLHYAFTQVVSALAATRCVFNSSYNLESFLEAGAAQLARMPDAPLADWQRTIRKKSEVLGVPLQLRDAAPTLGQPTPSERARGPVILWNHRWEYDKDPETFFGVLGRLAARGVPFRLAVCGERFTRAPAVFDQAQVEFADRIVHFGTIAARDEYLELLDRADIAVSTAQHEFFGIALLEAAHHGAYVLAPERLAYPEHFGAPHTYPTDAVLEAVLERLSRAYVGGATLRADRRILTEPYRADVLIPRFKALFERTIRG